MLTKILAAVVAVGLVLAYLGPLMVKMKDLALGTVILIGVIFIFVDLWHSLKKPED